jgi:hypothetical protein
MLGRMQLMVMDARVITCLRIIIRTTSPFAGISRIVKGVVDNERRVRIWTSCLRINEAIGLWDRELDADIPPRLVAGKDYRVNGNVALCIRKPNGLF